MKIKISHELKMKFLTMEGLSSEIETHEIGIQGHEKIIREETYYSVKLDLNNFPDCLKICKHWYDIIHAYFKTSYKAYRLDIGPYFGLWPTSVDDNIVNFKVDRIDTERKDWKDWFIKTDMEYNLNYD